jgi:hypothetical protein
MDKTAFMIEIVPIYNKMKRITDRWMKNEWEMIIW